MDKLNTKKLWEYYNDFLVFFAPDDFKKTSVKVWITIILLTISAYAKRDLEAIAALEIDNDALETEILDIKTKVDEQISKYNNNLK